jgi:hypothetical protein
MLTVKFLVLNARNMPIAFRVRIASRIVAVEQMNFIGSNARILVFSDELREGSAKKGKLLRSLPVVRGVKPSGGIVNRSHKISSLVQYILIIRYQG